MGAPSFRAFCERVGSTQVADPILKPVQTMVRVTAGGLNFADVMTTTGGYPELRLRR
jgi:NADPH:quinone reductase-like Zn-dependent oxidoreductase